MSVTGTPNGEELAFSEIEPQHIRHSVRFYGDADAGPTVKEGFSRDFPITDRGLNPDEVAELVGMNVRALVFSQADQPQDSLGSMTATLEAGFNLSGEEFLYGNYDELEQFDVDDSGTVDFENRSNSIDEQGLLWAQAMQFEKGYDDDSNGNGGAGGSGNHTEEWIPFRDRFGQGPIVDEIDDFSSKILLDLENMIATCEARATYSLYYNVMELEEARSRYGL